MNLIDSVRGTEDVNTVTYNLVIDINISHVDSGDSIRVVTLAARGYRKESSTIPDNTRITILFVTMCKIAKFQCFSTILEVLY